MKRPNQINLTKTDKGPSIICVELFFDAMAAARSKCDRGDRRELCAFQVKAYESYIGSNPKTGEKVQIEPKKLPFFEMGTDLKRRVDG